MDVEFINGQVKSLAETVYWAIEKDGEFVKGESITRKERDSIRILSDFTVHFYENGLHKRTDYYSYDGKINYWETEIEGDQMLKSTWTWKDTARYYFLYENNDNNHFIGGKGYRPIVDTLVNGVALEVNEDGFSISARFFNENDELASWNTNALTEENLTTEYKNYSESDSLLQHMKLEYNARGLITVETHLKPNGEIERDFISEYTAYDDMDNWVSMIMRDEKGVVVICERVYEYY